MATTPTPPPPDIAHAPAPASAEPGLRARLRLASLPERLAGRNNLEQLIELRWLAAGGQLATIVFSDLVLDVRLPLAEMLALLAVLVLFNGMSMMRARLGRPVTDLELFAALVVDVAVLTGQLYHAGGVSNPFIFLYLLQVAVASVLLRPQFAWAIVALATACFVALTQWHRPLLLADQSLTMLPADYIGGLLVCFGLGAVLLVVFIGRIQSNLRQRDASLAQLRQRAAEEEHIVRMGLLASGAAHELGTPLATLSVILGDWARMAPFAAEPELREELEEMQQQIDRCKAIVSGILASAGEVRGEAPVSTTLHAFLDEVAAGWQRTRGAARLDYRRAGLPDMAIVADEALDKIIGNILDNALEAAGTGHPVVLEATAEDGLLALRVRDQGPGFAPHILERLGTPYRSTKGAPGRGLGLFLAVNVARTLGGRVTARNRPEGGAEVTVRLPLSVLMRQSHAERGSP